MSDVKKPSDSEARRKDKRTRENAAIRDVMATEAGRKVVWWLLSECGVYQTSADLNAPNPAETAFFKEGQRNIGLTLIVRINHVCQELYQRMERENRPQT